MSKMPTGLAIIGGLHAFSAMFTTIAVIFSIPFIIVAFTQDLGLGAIASLSAIWGWIVAGIHGAIALAVFSRKSWSILAIKFLASIGIIFAILNILSGNMFAIFSLVMDGAILAYMRKESVYRWLNDDSIGFSKKED